MVDEEKIRDEKCCSDCFSLLLGYNAPRHKDKISFNNTNIYIYIYIYIYIGIRVPPTPKIYDLQCPT